jgi:hypothetical protein
MHILKIAAMATIGLFATGAQAADNASPIAGQFPATEDSMQVYLFMLKKNDISIDQTPQDFCGMLGYGKAVFWEQPRDVKDNTIVRGKLNWVICKFKGK